MQTDAAAAPSIIRSHGSLRAYEACRPDNDWSPSEAATSVAPWSGVREMMLKGPSPSPCPRGGPYNFLPVKLFL